MRRRSGHDRAQVALPGVGGWARGSPRRRGGSVLRSDDAGFPVPGGCLDAASCSARASPRRPRVLEWPGPVCAVRARGRVPRGARGAVWARLLWLHFSSVDVVVNLELLPSRRD